MRFEVHVPSSKPIKVGAAQKAIVGHFGIVPADVSLHSMSLSEDGKRATQPVAIFGYRGIRRAAEVRIAQMELQLGSYTPKTDVEELVVAQESGLKVNSPLFWLTRGFTCEATVAVIKDRRTGVQVDGVSPGVKVRLCDIPALMNDDRFVVWHGVIEQALKRQGRTETVDDIDWYQQYDAGSPSRADCIAEATRRAVNKL